MSFRFAGFSLEQIGCFWLVDRSALAQSETGSVSCESLQLDCNSNEASEKDRDVAWEPV